MSEQVKEILRVDDGNLAKLYEENEVILDEAAGNAGKQLIRLVIQLAQSLSIAVEIVDDTQVAGDNNKHCEDFMENSFMLIVLAAVTAAHDKAKNTVQ